MKPHDLQPQFKYMNYFIYTSHHFTSHGRYELNKLASLPTCGFIAQLVEHRTGIAEVTGSNPVEALIFFRLLLSNCLNRKFTAMIVLHFDLQPQFKYMNYFIYTSHQYIICTQIITLCNGCPPAFFTASFRVGLKNVCTHAYA